MFSVEEIDKGIRKGIEVIACCNELISSHQDSLKSFYKELNREELKLKELIKLKEDMITITSPYDFKSGETYTLGNVILNGKPIKGTITISCP